MRLVVDTGEVRPTSPQVLRAPSEALVDRYTTRDAFNRTHCKLRGRSATSWALSSGRNQHRGHRPLDRLGTRFIAPMRMISEPFAHSFGFVAPEPRAHPREVSEVICEAEPTSTHLWPIALNDDRVDCIVMNRLPIPCPEWQEDIYQSRNDVDVWASPRMPDIWFVE
jgi:hypothetical protein